MKTNTATKFIGTAVWILSTRKKAALGYYNVNLLIPIQFFQIFSESGENLGANNFLYIFL